MTTQTATTGNYILGNIINNQVSIYNRLFSRPVIHGSTLSDLSLEPYSEPIPSRIIKDVNFFITWGASDPDLYDKFKRHIGFIQPTTTQEQLIGEIRSWNLLETNQDDEGAVDPIIRNLLDEFAQDAVFTRPTTTREQLIGEIRSWALLEADWDGEGAAAPIDRCIKGAVSFIRLLPENIALPEPMLHASGNTGLFWGDDGIYADIEFLDNGRIAYYIEQNGDKHKGAINFDSKTLPPVFSALLGR